MKIDKFNQLKEIAARFMKFGEAQPAPLPKPENFEAVKVKGSDTMIEYDPTLAVGSDVMQSTGTGSTPAVDGSIELDNGIKFTVKDGKIESVQADGKDTEAETKTADEKMQALEAKFEALSVEFTAVKTELATANAALLTMPTAEVITKFNEDVKLIGEAIVELSDIVVEPQASPADKAEAQAEVKTNFEAVAAKFAGEK